MDTIPNRMSVHALSVIFIAFIATAVNGAIVATEADITVDCGTNIGGAVTITYNNADKTPVPVRMYGRKNKATCAVTSAQAASGVYTISDVRTNCDIVQPDPARSEYFIQIALQEISGIILSTDPVFNVECNYKAGEVVASSANLNIGESLIPTSIVVETNGNPDMTYNLNLLSATGTALTQASVGDQVVLEIKMSGTDLDEQSVQVKSCTASSGSSNVTFLENSCLVTGMSSLSSLPGFMTSGTRAFLPFTLFGVDGGTSSEVQYECVVSVCDTSCNGQNCGATGRRRRRAAGDEGEAAETEKSLTLARNVQLIPIGVYSPSAQAGQNSSISQSCFQSMGFIITVVVMGILLLVAMVIAIGLFTARRREFQKSTP